MGYGLKKSERKEEFTIQVNQQIKVYQHLIKGLEVCLPHIQAFNGKVANVKLITAISKEENPNTLLFNLTQKEGNSGMAIRISDFKNRAYPSVAGNFIKYLLSYECIFLLPTTKEDKRAQDRINSEEAVKQIEIEKKHLLKLIEECNTDLQMYDEEISVWEELEKQVEAYKKKFSPRLRGKITMDYR